MTSPLTLRDLAALCYLTSSWSSWPSWSSCSRGSRGLGQVLVLAICALPMGCRRLPAWQPPESGSEATAAVLAALPEDTGIVLGLDLDRLRAEPIWKALSPALAKLAASPLGDLVAGSGSEPARQTHHIWVALPGERQDDGRFLLLAEADPMEVERTAGRVLHAPAKLAVRRINARWVVIAQGAWIRATAGQAHSAANNPELRRLCQRAAEQHGFRFASLVPAPQRRRWLADGHSDLAALVRVFGFFDASSDFHAELVGELSNSTDPYGVAERLTAIHGQARRNPDLLIAGLAPYLAAIRIQARDASVHVAIEVPASQTADLVERILALALPQRTKYSRAGEQP